MAGLKLKAYHHRKWKSDYHKHHFQMLRKSTKLEISIAYKQYISKIQMEISDNLSSFWRFVNSKKNTSRIPAKVFDSNSEYEKPDDVASAFASQYSSLISVC